MQCKIDLILTQNQIYTIEKIDILMYFLPILLWYFDYVTSIILCIFISVHFITFKIYTNSIRLVCDSKIHVMVRQTPIVFGTDSILQNGEIFYFRARSPMPGAAKCGLRASICIFNCVRLYEQSPQKIQTPTLTVLLEIITKNVCLKVKYFNTEA